LSDPRVEIQVKDGVAYIATQKNQFDVILIDSTDPLGPGEGLFTNAFYQDVKAALKPGGLMVAQSESPFVDQKEIRLMYALLNEVFSVVVPYVGPIPTYPGGYWSWAFCSNGPKPLDHYRFSEAQRLEKITQYYNTHIHQACFAVPNFLKPLLAEKNIVAPFPALKPELAPC
ncbi:MAG: spermidine synthase, partial [Cyanobacteria bacterium]|nr:spermidine synthase [Cyanobacteriota bacterium]